MERQSKISTWVLGVEMENTLQKRRSWAGEKLREQGVEVRCKRSSVKKISSKHVGIQD